MFQRMMCPTALAAVVLAVSVPSVPAALQPGKESLALPEEHIKAKKALQEVQDFIGLWKLEGTQKVGAKTEAWKEDVSWGWKLKDGNSWINAEFAEGKANTTRSGELLLRCGEEEVRPHARSGGKGRGGCKCSRATSRTASLRVERKGREDRRRVPGSR